MEQVHRQLHPVSLHQLQVPGVLAEVTEVVRTVAPMVAVGHTDPAQLRLEALMVVLLYA
jgi:hypothetical protein